MPEPRLGIIVPAAGGSGRLGQPKQLLSVGGESLIRRSVRLAVSLRPRQLVVVSGAFREEVEAELEGLSVRVAHHPGWESGMGGSIAAGARVLEHNLDGVMVLLCDQWRLQQEDLSRLLASWKQDSRRIRAARWSDACGPPVIFPASFLPGLRGLEGDRGARAIIEQDGVDCRFLDIPNAGFDMDTPEDLQALIESGSS